MPLDVSGAQERLARESKQRLNQDPRYQGGIVTEITPASTFWRAEEYHQKYLQRGFYGSSCKS